MGGLGLEMGITRRNQSQFSFLVFCIFRGSTYFFILDCKNQNEQYTDCGNSCGEDVCGKPKWQASTCAGECVKGCFCEKGFIRDGLGMCISNDECKKYLDSSECEKQLIAANPYAIGMAGGFTPSCERDGHFSPVQCHGSTGYCWCVEQDGTEIPGSRIRGEPVCSKRNEYFKSQTYHL